MIAEMLAVFLVFGYIFKLLVIDLPRFGNTWWEVGRFLCSLDVSSRVCG